MFKYYIYTLLIAAGGSFLLTPIVRKISLAKGFLDRPGGRKIHRGDMPTLGGIAICVSFLAAMLIAFRFVPQDMREFSHGFMGLCIGGLIIIGLGIYDDIKGVRARLKLLVQVLVAIVLIMYGIGVGEITSPFGGKISLGTFGLGIFGILFTIFWIVGSINAINLLDGMDGLAAGITGIVAFFLFLAAVSQGNIVVAFLALALAGSAFGFLPFNFYPAKIFMGDAGSMFMGLILSVIAIEGYMKSRTVIALIVPIVAMSVPIIDTSLAIVRRIARKRHIFHADREHVHHRLLMGGRSQRQVVLSLYFLSACFGLIAFSLIGFKGAFVTVALVLVGFAIFNWIKVAGFLEFRQREERIKVRIPKEGFGVAKSVWSMTFKMVRRYPCILFPFFMIAVSQAIVLTILFYFPRPPLTIIFAQPIRAFFGEQFLHYPANFLLLPRLFYFGQVLAMVTIGAIMFGTAIGLIYRANKKEEKLSVVGNLTRSTKYYLTLVGIWVVIFGLSLMILRFPGFLITKFLSRTPLVSTLLQVLFYGGFLLVFLVEALFIYAYPAAIIEEKGLLGAIKRSLRVSKKVFGTTFILIAIPRVLEVLVIAFRRYSLMRVNRVLPELTLVILGLVIAASFIADFLVMSSTVNLFILTKEAEG